MRVKNFVASVYIYIYIYIFVCFSNEARIMIMMIFTVNWSMSQWSRFDQTIESSVRQNENSE